MNQYIKTPSYVGRTNF